MKTPCVLMLFALPLCANFDLDKVVRELKKDAPWGLQGSAQNLRSDIKHQLQQIMNQFTLLWPEAVWAKGDAPSLDNLQQALQNLMDYVQAASNPEWSKQAQVSLDYIINQHVPAVGQKLVQGAKKQVSDNDMQVLEHKKELFGQLKNQLLEARKQISSLLV